MGRALRLGALATVLGAWLGVTAASWAIAAASFRTLSGLQSVDGDPSASGQRWRDALAQSEDGPAAARYQTAELNRWMFDAFGNAQLVLAGMALLLAAWPGTGLRWTAAAVALAALLAGALAVAIVPWTGGLGRDLAFSPDPPPPEIAQALETMQGLHATFATLDLLKVALLALAVAGVLRALTHGVAAGPSRTAIGRRPRPRRVRHDERFSAQTASRPALTPGDADEEP